jgi:hypothetical protein
MAKCTKIPRIKPLPKKLPEEVKSQKAKTKKIAKAKLVCKTKSFLSLRVSRRNRIAPR